MNVKISVFNVMIAIAIAVCGFFVANNNVSSQYAVNHDQLIQSQSGYLTPASQAHTNYSEYPARA